MFGHGPRARCFAASTATTALLQSNMGTWPFAVPRAQRQPTYCTQTWAHGPFAVPRTQRQPPYCNQTWAHGPFAVPRAQRQPTYCNQTWARRPFAAPRAQRQQTYCNQSWAHGPFAVPRAQRQPTYCNQTWAHGPFAVPRAQRQYMGAWARTRVGLQKRRATAPSRSPNKLLRFDCPHQESNLGCRGHNATS